MILFQIKYNVSKKIFHNFTQYVVFFAHFKVVSDAIKLKDMISKSLFLFYFIFKRLIRSILHKKNEMQKLYFIYNLIITSDC